MQTHKFDRAYIQTNTRARSASAQSTSITLIVDWRPLLQVVGGDIETVIVSGERAGFPDPELGAVTVFNPEALKAEALTAARGFETVPASGERTGFPGPELGAVAICTPEALKADVKKTYDPSILVARPDST